MRQGRPTIKRVNARNYIQQSSQERLDETVVPYNKQILNSLAVDYVPVMYYNSLHSGLPCSCEQQDTVSDLSPDTVGFDNEVTRNSQTDTGRSFVIGKDGGSTFGDFDDVEVINEETLHTMFGDNGASIDSEDEYDLDLVDESDAYAPVEEQVEMYNSDNAIFAGHNVNCGLCYRTGFIPSHSLNRGMRIVLTHHDIQESVGYFLNKGEYPYRFERLVPDGHVTFSLKIPKYYVKASFSIRNNLAVLNDKLYATNAVLDYYLLKGNAGKTISITVKANAFTHIVIEFQTNVEPIQANIPNINRTLDYTMLETIGNLNVVLPMNIGAVVAGDLIAAPTRNLYLKVVDITYTQTAKMRHLEWTANCRVLQPQEALRKLFFTRPF